MQTNKLMNEQCKYTRVYVCIYARLESKKKKKTLKTVCLSSHTHCTHNEEGKRKCTTFFFIKICVVSFPFDSSFPFNSPAPVQYLVFVYSNSDEDLYATTRALRDRDQTDMCSVSSTVLYRTHNTYKHNKISIVVTVLRIPLYRCSAYTYIDTKPIHTSHSVASVCRQ